MRNAGKRVQRRVFDKDYKPTCYRCGKQIKELIEFNWYNQNQKHSAGWFSAQKKVNNKVVHIGKQKVINSKFPDIPIGTVLYRHDRDSCTEGIYLD
jgi:hypothetical protein